MKTLTLIILTFFTLSISSQNEDITSNLYETYEQYKEKSLNIRRIKHRDIQPLINVLKKDKKYTVKKVGTSIEGRDLTLISIGKGKTNVFLWSQMHGDEPTATQAIFDIINFFNAKEFHKEKKKMLSQLTIHFLPMLNPDGAERYTRRNTLGIDINRDALRLQSPEGRTLKRIRDSLSADFGFNLHDQSTYYNAERTNKPATISYLAPAYNYEKEINDVRADAMRVIVFMNDIIQKYAKGQVGRYNDDFEPRAFGDNIQKWGTSTILIESGGYKNDVEKQEIRKLNYVSILAAIYTIAKGNYKSISIDKYETIPQNDRKLFDLKIENVTYNLLGKKYILDLGINRFEIDNKTNSDFYNLGKIMDQGDLSTFYGYETLNATGYELIQGKKMPKAFNSLENISYSSVLKLLKKGFIYLPLNNLPKNNKELNLPINIVNHKFESPDLKIYVGTHANFFLAKDGKIKYAVVNGFLIDLSAENLSTNFRNGMIYR